MNVCQLEETVRNMVMRYGSRIWKLRVMQAEIKMTIRLNYFRSSYANNFWLPFTNLIYYFSVVVFHYNIIYVKCKTCL